MYVLLLKSKIFAPGVLYFWHSKYQCSGLNYKQAIHYLLQQLPMFQRIGAAAYRIDLDNITRLCDLLNNPQSSLRCIHVAGTNGKGSVTHIIASILQEQGYKTGIFVSPHYKDYRERIKINGQLHKQGVCASIC